MTVIQSRRIAIAAVIFGAAALPGAAHETDQYTVPLGRQFADLGPYLTHDFRERIAQAVEKLNSRIHRASQTGQSFDVLTRLRSPDAVASAVHAEFPTFVTYIDDLEHLFHSRKLKDRYPGLIVAHRPLNWIYASWFPMDIGHFYRLWGSSTITARNVHFGTDKIGHFVHNGYFYYQEYRRALARDGDESKALQKAVNVGAGNDFFRSESQLLGYFTSGVFSNADLASNYGGLKFYRNLTEDVRVADMLYPSILIQRDGLWHFRPVLSDDFLTWLITDHWDEVLNPGLYTLGMKGAVRQAVAQRCDSVVRWYTDINGVRHDKQYFDSRMEEMRTFYGEEYGHRMDQEERISVADVCFPAENKPDDAAAPARLVTHAPSPDAAYDKVRNLHELTSDAQRLIDALNHTNSLNDTDARGRTALRWAVRYGNAESVRLLLDAGANPNIADHDGETPLHDAVRLGHENIVRLLQERGAAANAKGCYGTTPLHLAVRFRRRDIVPLLVMRGADVNAMDDFGCTSAHDASGTGETGILADLLHSQANVNATDRFGNTPLHLAARGGHYDAVKVLLNHGAAADTVNQIGRTPRDEAAASPNTALFELIRDTTPRDWRGTNDSSARSNRVSIGKP